MYEYIEKYMKKRLNEGACGNALSVYKSGEKVYGKFMGSIDHGGKAVDENTLFRIYSMTKVMIAVAAMMLFERGEFQLNDEIGKYLPEFESPMVCHHNFEGKPYLLPNKNPLTIESLLSMTSGIVSGGESYVSRQMGREMERVNKETGGNPTLADKVSALSRVPLAFEPGEHFRYGAGLNVIGRLIEVISGRSLGEFLKEETFEKLGMHDTVFFVDQNTMIDRVCALYVQDKETGKFERSYKYDPAFIVGRKFEDPSGGILSTLSDCAKFADALCMGKILHPKTLNIMKENRLNDVALKEFRACAQNLSGYGYGLGVRTMMEPEKCGSLSSKGEFGWFGMAGSYMLMDTTSNISIIYMEQVIPEYDWNFPHPLLRNAVYAAFDK